MNQKRVLIYDDDLEILAVCEAILHKLNYQVKTYTNCDNVLSDILKIKPDIVLMDLWIPKIGGERAIVLMKEKIETQHIPVILFSANDETEKIAERVKADGF